jgi:Holliday junction resolvasome RuvABC endonuclease subunit
MTSRPKAYAGIDPGVRGAAALLHDGGVLVERWPRDVVKAAGILSEWSSKFDLKLTAVEKILSWKGRIAAYMLGENTGMWIGILSALKVPFVTVRPNEWQKGLVDRKSGSTPKQRSVATASRLFPGLTISAGDDGVADALLLAFWARMRMEGARYVGGSG